MESMFNPLLFQAAMETVKKADAMPPPGGVAAPQPAGGAPGAPAGGAMMPPPPPPGDDGGDPYGHLIPLIQHVIQQSGGAGGAGGGKPGGKAKIEPEVIMQMIQAIDQKITTQNHLLAKIAETMGINFSPNEAVSMAHPGTDEAEAQAGQGGDPGGVPGGAPPGADPAAAAAGGAPPVAAPQPKMAHTLSQELEAMSFLLAAGATP